MTLTEQRIEAIDVLPGMMMDVRDHVGSAVGDIDELSTLALAASMKWLRVIEVEFLYVQTVGGSFPRRVRIVFEHPPMSVKLEAEEKVRVKGEE